MYYSLINSRNFNSNNNSSDYYIIDCSLNCDSTQLAVNLSNDLIEILDSKTLQTITAVKDLENMNHMIKYSTQNTNHLIVSSFDSINIYDLRHKTSKISKQFKINFRPEMCLHLDQTQIHMTCFDFNYDNFSLVSGTELCEDNNVYIIFWDLRKCAQVLNVFHECHQNNMTCIRFHPNIKNIFATGSCDQLINIFDINKSEEEESLVATLNVENAVEKIVWSQTNDNNLFCITQEESLQLWDYEEVVPKVSLSAHSIDSKFDYVIDVLPKDVICVGDKSGSLSLFDINNVQNDDKNDIIFKSYLTKGHNKMVRTVCSPNDNSIVYSGGEDGVICLWNDSFDSVVNKSHNKTKNKMKRIDSKNRSNPY